MGSKKNIHLYLAVRWERFLSELNCGKHEMRVINGWSDFTKCSASGIATVTEPKLTSQVGECCAHRPMCFCSQSSEGASILV
jgi:hypothetical protein